MTAATLSSRRASLRLGLALGAAAILIFSAIAAVSVGAVAIPLATVWGIVIDRIAPGLVESDWATSRAKIVMEIRFPRTLLAGLVGAGLGVVGAALQAVTRNPLSDPHLLGISSGGAFGAILALLHVGMILGLLTVPIFAFAGAMAATLLVLAVARLASATSADRLVLAGVAVSFVVMAAGNTLILIGDPRATHTVVFWMLGGLGLAQWPHLIWPLIVLLSGGAWLWGRAEALNAMSLGDETAATLGINPGGFRMAVFVVCALITGIMVAFSGVIGFVGLMMPHLVRLVFGGDNARVLPGSALLGAVFLIWADAAARVLLAPEDIPIGIVTGLCGGIFFIWMMARRN
jgi:iron complex transport system permease protein